MNNNASDSKKGAVSREQIVDAVLELIDEIGYEQLSMRKLASRLEVFPTTIYWHAGNKSSLLALVSESVLSQIEFPDVSLSWDDWLMVLGMRVRGVIGRHPRFASYFLSNIQASRAAVTLAERILHKLEDGGFRGNGLTHAYNSYTGALFGWITGEFATVPEGYGEENKEFYDTVFSDPEACDEYATISRIWPSIQNRAFMLRWDSGTVSPMAPSFELMLQSLLTGLKSSPLRAPSEGEALER